LTDEIIGDETSILALQPLDDLADVFAGTGNLINIPALLTRYKDYLARLAAIGVNPWVEQLPSYAGQSAEPIVSAKRTERRKTDLKLKEAVGQFHLFSAAMGSCGKALCGKSRISHWQWHSRYSSFVWQTTGHY
jgi:hypothetical protein